MRLFCFDCHKPITNEIPDSTIFRAVATCPECVEKEEERDQLKAENERLREALQEIANDCKKLFSCDYSNKMKVYDIAQQALNEVTK